jgi:type IV pilus assembly protein PilC
MAEYRKRSSEVPSQEAALVQALTAPAQLAGTSAPSREKPKKGLIETLFEKNIPPHKLKITNRDLAIFFQQLAVILQSGVPIAQGLELLSENLENRQFGKAVGLIAIRLSAGNELSECFSRYPLIFRPITVGLIKAGEIGGILDRVIERISLFIERQENIKGQLVSALIYPCIMLIFALAVALGLLIGIVPKFANVFAQLNSELPTITKVMLALSGAVTNPVIMGAIGALLVGGFFAAKAFYATSQGRLVLDRLVFYVPLFGSLLLKYEVASFCETLATLTNAGIPAVEGMEVTAGASNNQVIKNTIRFTAQRAEQGEVISEVLASTKIFPPLVAAMIRIGEESGQLSTMLENLGRFYTQEIEITVKKITKAMEPAITGVVSVIVGSIVLSLYLPMFKLMEVMGK